MGFPSIRDLRSLCPPPKGQMGRWDQSGRDLPAKRFQDLEDSDSNLQRPRLHIHGGLKGHGGDSNLVNWGDGNSHGQAWVVVLYPVPTASL